MNYQDSLDEIKNDFLNGDYEKIKKDVQSAIDTGINQKVILEKGLMNSINIIGELFDKGERYVPDLLISGEVMQKGLEILKPYISAKDKNKMSGKVAIGTVEGDVHDIGKNLVISMLTGGGFEIIDLGVDVKPEKFLEVAKSEQPKIIAMSSLINITMESITKTIELFKKVGLRNSYKFLIGGAVVDEKFATECGADAYGDNAFQAVVQAKKLISELEEIKNDR